MREQETMTVALWIERYGGDCQEAEVMEPDDRVGEGYGLQVQVLTPEHLAALQEGKAVAFDILGEYGALIFMKKP